MYSGGIVGWGVRNYRDEYSLPLGLLGHDSELNFLEKCVWCGSSFPLHDLKLKVRTAQRFETTLPGAPGPEN